MAPVHLVFERSLAAFAIYLCVGLRQAKLTAAIVLRAAKKASTAKVTYSSSQTE